MTWLVSWEGRELDVDFTEFNGLEMKQIKLLTGYTFRDLLDLVPAFDSEALRVIFWTVDRRSDDGLKFSEYGGPSVRVILPQIDGLLDALDDLGKSMEAVDEKMRAIANRGSDLSATSTDGAPRDDIEL